MNLLPKTSGSRPRLACEIFADGVVAGRSPEPGLPLAAVAKVGLAESAVMPGLKPGNLADRVAVIAAIRRVLEQVGARSNARNADLTLVIPDAAVRVLLLDFDALPSKLSEALPIVRFRLKKLIPFEADDAMVSFQVMSSSRSIIRVLAVAIPRDVLGEYESAAREAGFEPGAVLPSTLAALAAVDEGEGASLVVNAHAQGFTTAIVRAGILLLHRTIELAEFAPGVPANLPPALFESSAATVGNGTLLPLVDPHDTQAEWAAQEPLPEYGRNPYADRVGTETATQNQDTITDLPVPYARGANQSSIDAYSQRGGHTVDMYAGEAAPVSRSPYASPTLQDELDTQFHNAVLVAPTGLDALTTPEAIEDLSQLAAFAADRGDDVEPLTHTLAPDAQGEELARAVSVAIAYFEDSLSAAPEVLLSAGPLGADHLNSVLREQGIAQEDGVRVRELIAPAELAPGAVTSAVPRGWLAGITGALRS